MEGNPHGAITSLGLAVGCLVCPYIFVAALHEAAADGIFALPGELEAGINALNGGGAGSQLVNSINGMGDQSTMFPEADSSIDVYVGFLVVTVLIPEMLMLICACILPKGGVDNEDDGVGGNGGGYSIDHINNGGFSPGRANRSPRPRGGEPKTKPKKLKESRPANSPATGHKSKSAVPDRSGARPGVVPHGKANNNKARQHRSAWNDDDDNDPRRGRADVVLPDGRCAYGSSEICTAGVCFKRQLQLYAPQCHKHTCGLPKCTQSKSSRAMCCSDHARNPTGPPY